MNSGVPAEVVSTHTAQLFEAAVKRASHLLAAGDVVALPTETVYGLAANALDGKAVAKIFEIKGRPAHNPIIVHVADVAMAKRCVKQWTEMADKLAMAFWPGPLTLVLPRSPAIPDGVTAGGDTVGVRWPGHPFIQAVVRECGFPLAAPSANLSNRISPTNAEHVRSQLGDKIRLIVDGGQSQVGIESTVVDLTTHPPQILRPGMVHEESLMAVMGALKHSILGEGEGRALRSPGQLQKHYSPKARLVVLNWSDDSELRSRAGRYAPTLSGCHVIAHTNIPSGEGFGCVSVIPHDAEAFARAFYAELHRCDDAGAELIVVESPPAAAEWRAISDRLQRASSEGEMRKNLPIGREAC